jgi:AdoMet-dependent rRNA methyltransferase SPB1
MGKPRKTGRERLDKYYTLAKEKGYRARSAFKLLQLNKKYDFLGDAHILVDLCAAPGGWLQVASQEMPMRRKIIGVDLEPIKHIGDVETLVCDITSEECRRELKRILGGHKADVVLHDGAPNVGTSWDSDAFNQNLLVLHSLRLANEFLRGGGIFVTKVFRSADYDALLDVCNKLFESVESTKPLSSRSQSAEIFVVCRGFVGEENVDEDVLEPSAVFKELREAGGYESFNFYKKISFTDIMRISSHHRLVEALLGHSEVVIDLDEGDADKLLSKELLLFFKDLKVLGKSEIRSIVRAKRQMVRKIRSGELEVPALSFLLEEPEEEEEEELREKSIDEKITEIQELIYRRRRQESRATAVEEGKGHEEVDCFFRDPIFKNLALLQENEDDVEEMKEIEVSSCSDSLDLDEEELACMAKLKSDPKGFLEDTIDRYIRDPNEKLPNYLREDQDVEYARPSKLEARRHTKKELEALQRRKTRAERRAEKFMANVIVDDSEEEGVVAKKILRSSYKKTKSKPRVIFPKQGRCGVPRGRGRLVALDKRLKKDKRTRR